MSALDNLLSCREWHIVFIDWKLIIFRNTFDLQSITFHFTIIFCAILLNSRWTGEYFSFKSFPFYNSGTFLDNSSIHLSIYIFDVHSLQELLSRSLPWQKSLHLSLSLHDSLAYNSCGYKFIFTFIIGYMCTVC